MKKCSFLYIFCTVVLIITAGSLVSCQNFLKGADIKNELEERIAYANAKECKVFIDKETEMGSFLSNSEITFKIGFNKELQFTLNVDSYKFNGLEAVSSRDETQSRSDCIEYVINQDKSNIAKSIYVINVKVVKDADDILIRPKCILIPKISEVYPPFSSTGYDQDTTIMLTFNKSVNPDSFGDFSCISIWSADGSLITSYYEKPYFSNNNTVLNIPADKTKNIINPDGTENLKDVVIKINTAELTDVDGLSLSDFENFAFRLNKQVDTVMPSVSMSLFKPVYELTANTDGECSVIEKNEYLPLSNLEFGRFDNDTYFQNHVGSKIYYDAVVTDNNSGYKKLIIKETLLKLSTGTSASADTIETSEIKKDSYEKEVYVLKSEYDGVVQLDFCFEDYAGNTNTQSYIVIKDTVSDSKETFSYESIDYTSEENNLIKQIIPFERIKTDTFYKTSANTKQTDRIIKVFWGDKNNPNLNKIDKLSSDLTITRNPSITTYARVIAMDAVGNIEQLDFVFPKRIDALGIDTSEKQNWSYTSGGTTVQYGYYKILTENISFESQIQYKIYYQAGDSSPMQDMGSSSYGFDVSSGAYTDQKQFRPAGIYKIYPQLISENPKTLHICAEIGNPVNVKISYSGDVQQIQTNIVTSSQTPAFPSDFTVNVKQMVKNAGTRDVCVSLPESFAQTSGFTYGVKIDEEYYDYDFTIKSGKIYDVYLYAKNNNSDNLYLSTVSKELDATADNIPPTAHFSNDYACPNEILFSSLREIDDDLLKDNSGNYLIQYCFVAADTQTDLTYKTISISADTPLHIVYDKYTEARYKLYMLFKDTSGNERESSYSISNIVYPVTQSLGFSTMSSRITITTTPIKGEVSKSGTERSRCYILENNSWSHEQDYSNQQNYYFFDLNKKSNFFKLATFIKSKGFAPYVYIYPEYELMEAAVKANYCKSKSMLSAFGNSYQLFYDAPCFVHTMAFPTSMLEDIENQVNKLVKNDKKLTKDMARALIWATKGSEYGIQVINNAFTAGTATYTAPVEDIPANFSYVTICHFVDGSAVMSDVKSK